MFNWINKYILRRSKSETMFPSTYVCEVYVNHPRIKDRVVTFLVAIDAYNKHHARRQLKHELQFSFGKAVLKSKLQ